MIKFSDLKAMAPAYAELCKKIKNPKKNKKGVHNAAYADLDAVIETSKEILAEYGFAIIQHPTSEDHNIGIETMLLHESGEYILGNFKVPSAHTDPQKIGGLITYYRRYCLVAMLNLVGEIDDDADSISEHAKSVSKNQLATDGQKKFLFQLLGMDEYNQHKVFIETQMTKEQASKRIEELKK